MSSNVKTSSPACPKCKGADFELRILREEAIASARCLRCSADYLLLDSKDYWFDVIQKGYPRLTRCSCKSESFRLRIDYSMRDDGDIDYVEVHAICSACDKTRRQLCFEVDYAGTGHLRKKPLVPCKRPKLLYELKDLHLLLTGPDVLRIVDHLAGRGCEFLSNMRRADRWILVRQKAVQAKATIESGRYLFVYATPHRIEVSEDQIDTIKREGAFWKRAEVIRISSRSHVCSFGKNSPSICYCSDPPAEAGYAELGLSFYINFSNEFVRRERIVRKSEAFRQVTANLLAMLQDEFVSWRAPYCFDNPDVNVRVFGDRFKKKAITKAKSRK